MRVGRTALIAVLATLATAAAPHRFSFRAIEFEPAETRLPAARAFLARVAAPGTPMGFAVATIEHADAACRRPRRAGQPIVCTSSRPEQRSDFDSLLGDLTWTVRLRPAADGSVGNAEVDRERYGS
jgi:hypothetical protein